MPKLCIVSGNFVPIKNASLCNDTLRDYKKRTVVFSTDDGAYSRDDLRELMDELKAKYIYPEHETTTALARQIGQAKAIVIVGSDPLHTISALRRSGITEYLAERFHLGTPVVGQNAGGAACGSVSIISEFKKDLKLFLGLNFIENAIFVPGYDSEAQPDIDLTKKLLPEKRVVGTPLGSQVLWSDGNFETSGPVKII